MVENKGEQEWKQTPDLGDLCRGRGEKRTGLGSIKGVY